MRTERLVIVCRECWRACCYQRRVMCADRETAGKMRLPESKLRKLFLEHPSHYEEAK